MKSSIVWKVLVTVGIIVTLSFIAISAALSIWFKGYYFGLRRNFVLKESERISKAAVEYFENKQSTSFDSLGQMVDYVSNEYSMNIVLVDSVGYVYKVSSEKFGYLKYRKLDVKGIDKLKKGESVEDNSENKELMQDVGVIVYRPVMKGNEYYGFIAMASPIDSKAAPLRSFYLIIWISAIIAVVVCLVVVSMLIRKMLINPLSEINTAAKKLAKGEVGGRVEINSNDEIKELADSFNVMAESLEKVDNNRREFISNVSHELRSPITSIKGFIAGILDGVIPKDKENYYLNIVYDEIQRLTRLVNELLDLSAMESGKMNLNVREIELNEVIRTVVMNLESKIIEKNLNLEVIFKEKREFVLGDLDRIIQVITNILDNAIKYCGQGGNIKITTKGRGNKVHVSIFNDGPIMEDSELNHIWERFYKADKSRTNKMSTGLGLPIVRQIISNHRQDIWVENAKDNLGVIFTFTLAKI